MSVSSEKITLCPGGCGRDVYGHKHPNVEAQLFFQCKDCNVEGWRHVSKFRDS